MKEPPHPLPASILRGIEQDVRRLSGAVATHVIEPHDFIVEEHRHDWPILSIFIMGDAVKAHDEGEVRVNRPAVILHGAGEPHVNRVGAAGFEQLDIQFDPAWLGRPRGDDSLRGVVCWTGGKIVAEADRLKASWLRPDSSEHELAFATQRFLHVALGIEATRLPGWLPIVLQKLEGEAAVSTQTIAQDLGLHPGWLAQSYKAAVGEGLRQTLQRRRVEQATRLLRATDLEPADIAAACGFCDQSHMIRTFKRMLGRTPTRVRSERERLPRSSARCLGNVQ